MESVTERLRPRAVTAFAALTLLIWTNRIWLAWTNPDDTVGEKIAWSTPITVFWICAATVLALQITGRAVGSGFATLVRVFAGGTILYWAIRMAIIIGGDWEVGFKVVHAVLAIGSAVAAGLAWRSLGRRTPGAG